MVMFFWIVIALTSLILSVAFLPRLINDWIRNPWRLVVACRKQGIPGFRFIPFVGQLRPISKALRSPESGQDWEELKRAQRCVEEYGKVFYFTTGKTVRICISDPDLVKAVLANNSDSFAKPSFIHVLDVLGDGLFRAYGDVWARQRKLLGLAFTSKEIKTEVGSIITTARAALEKWVQQVNSNSGELEIHHNLLQLTLNVIRKLAFGEDAAPLTANTGEEDSSTLITGAFDRYLHNSRELVFGPAAAIPGYRFLPATTNREITEDQRWLLGVIDELIEARSKKHANASTNATSPAEPRDRKDFLDLVMGAAQSGAEELTLQQVRGNSAAILLAGHHTTASLLAWTMYMLAVQPDWQDRARAEVRELCEDGEVGWDTLSKMKTIGMILQETLRLFPPVPLIGRLCLAETSLGPYRIPEGVEILIPTAVLHHDKGLWGEDSDQFLPDRFAKGIGKASKHVMGFLPFGSGPRTCIGQILALAEAKAVLAVILQAFSWKLGPGYRHCPDVSLTLKPKFDIPLMMEKL